MTQIYTVLPHHRLQPMEACHWATSLSVKLLLSTYPTISQDHLQLGMWPERVMAGVLAEGLVSTFNILLLHNYYQETTL